MKRITIESLGLTLILCSIFLASMNFAAKYFYLVYIAFFLLILTFRSLIINPSLIFYVCFGLARAYFAWRAENSIFSVLRQFAFILSYIIGFNIILHNKNRQYNANKNNLLVNVIFVLAAGSFVHLSLNLLINLGTSGTRNTIDIWSRSVMAATGQAALACLSIGMSIATLIKPIKPKDRILAAFALVVIFYYNLTISSRTILIMTAIVTICGVIFLMTSNLENHKKRTIISVGAIIFVALIIAYKANLLNIQSVVSNSNMYDRVINHEGNLLDQSSRLKAKLYYLRNMFDYPFGGGFLHASYGGYAHDLLLDAYDEGGIFLLLPLIGIIASMGNNSLRFLRNMNICFEIKILLFCVVIAISCEFFVEPILAGMPWLFSSFAILHGSVSSLNSNRSQYNPNVVRNTDL